MGWIHFWTEEINELRRSRFVAKYFISLQIVQIEHIVEVSVTGVSQIQISS